MRSYLDVRCATSVLVVVVLLAGCASQDPDTTTLDSAVQPTVADPPSAAAIPAAAGGYKLTEVEQKLDCPKLTGQMRVRIANMRATVGQTGSSTTSRTIQSLATPVYGGTSRGIDPAADLQRDRAKLEAFNKRLAEKKCKTLDLDAELRGETPAPPPPKSKAPATAAPSKS